MDFLRKFWPVSFKVVKGKYTTFYACFFFYAIICFLLKQVSQITTPVQILSTILYCIYLAVDVYSVVGVVLCVCQLFGVITQH